MVELNPAWLSFFLYHKQLNIEQLGQKEKTTMFLTRKASLPLTPDITPVPHLKSQLLHLKSYQVLSSAFLPW